jgi:glycosyltransferase involved in cell wall biosynthesis
MKILLIMDPLITVPPIHYGGIERVVADLANGLIKTGHDVTLWAAPGSKTDGKLVSFGKVGEWTRWSNLRNTLELTRRFLLQHRFDVIHNFGRLAYLLPIVRSRTPKFQTYMRTVNPANIAKMERFGSRNLTYTAVSDFIANTGRPGGGKWEVIYNCAPVEKYAFNPNVDAEQSHLAFLGRLDRCKGCHSAIAAAKATGRTLHIAGTISDIPHEKEYFEREIAPHIDGKQIVFLGPVNDQQKNELLGKAAGFLLPIEWDEPFPVVLPESLLCGTPIICFRNGGVTEGITEGKTGFICDNVAQMSDAIGKLSRLSREDCRREAVSRFSDEVIVDQYLSLYTSGNL